MTISDRLRQQHGDDVTSPEPPTHRPEAAVSDALGEFRQQVHDALFRRLGDRMFDPNLNESELHAFVAQEIADLMATSTVPLNVAERQTLAAEIMNDVIGLGPVQQFADDPTITEIMVNSLDPIYVERHGLIERTHARFLTEEQLRRVIDRIVADVGRRIDESSPMVDARLADGSRVNAVIPPLAVDGPALTIRKFSRDPLQVDDLVQFGTLTPELAELFRLTVEGELNILISGGTGTGKTTLLNVMSSFIPGTDRIVTIEDAVELQLHQEHIVRLESRPANMEGRGEVTIRDLVRNSLRMRPDRIIVGEVRGPETLDMLQAMNTGHEGSLSTVHANSPRDALSRLETMVLLGGLDLPTRAIREQMASALDLIIHLQRLRDGSRRITAVEEVVGMEGDIVTLSGLWTFDWSAGIGPDGRFLGNPRPTGIRPTFVNRLDELGLEVPSALYGADLDIGYELDRRR